MAERSIAAFSLRFRRSIGIRQVRLFTGLILFSYLISHFTNHALGNISISAMEEGMTYHIAFWRSWPVAIVFYRDWQGEKEKVNANPRSSEIPPTPPAHRRLGEARRRALALPTPKN